MIEFIEQAFTVHIWIKLLLPYNFLDSAEFGFLSFISPFAHLAHFNLIHNIRWILHFSSSGLQSFNFILFLFLLELF